MEIGTWRQGKAAGGNWAQGQHNFSYFTTGANHYSSVRFCLRSERGLFRASEYVLAACPG